ncbi:MAG: HAMP domain-containing protein, partial [Candidatus Omnitrophica bacterium]|nr:HAMP domain-containing protein [Candidatus Omnitrophota bacterium]
MTFFKIEATERRSLRYRLVLAFSLMSIIPLLILGYIITSFIFPDAKYTAEISAILLFAVWISWLGYLFIRQIITPILDLALETRIISEGKFSPKFSMTKEDELGDIAAAVNTMTGKIRSYIAELQD